MKRCALLVSLAAVCGIGCVVGPTPAAARSGGGGFAAAAGVHGGMRLGAGAFLHGSGRVFLRGFAAMRAFRPLNLRRRQISVLPYGLGYGDFEPFYYYPPADVADNPASPTSDPAAPSQVPANRILVVKPGCRTEEQKVRSEAGGEQLIHITRCY